MRWRAVMIACLGVLAACDAAPPPPPPEEPAAPASTPEPVEGFAHEAGLEVTGFYLPASEVRIGDLRLSHLFIGDDETFEAWEAAGGRGSMNFPPIMFQFDDLSSETLPNDLGGQTPSVVLRVLPGGYGVSDRTIRFTGIEPRLGLVTFEGAFDPRSADSQQRGVRGTLTIDGRIYEGQGFTRTAGG